MISVLRYFGIFVHLYVEYRQYTSMNSEYIQKDVCRIRTQFEYLGCWAELTTNLMIEADYLTMFIIHEKTVYRSCFFIDFNEHFY